jgi:pimeloyl-ACP methyl ester carboxylesterase
LAIVPRARTNGIELEYEVVGNGAPLVLVMGIGAQMVAWPDGFIASLVDAGFRVIRFDNRDTGLSTHLGHLPTPRWRPRLAKAILGLRVDAPYTLLDMADDVAGLLDVLGIARAHVLGASLGGFVAQSMAIAHPHRVASLISLMSSPGSVRATLGRPSALRALLAPPPRSPQQAGDLAMAFTRVCGSRGFALDEPDIRRRAILAYERGHDPRGFVRQLLATLATGDRSSALRFVRTPTLVMHGTDDTLIPPAGGRATAAAMPNARLRLIRGMGHDLPPGAWPVVTEAVARHVRESS